MKKLPRDYHLQLVTDHKVMSLHELPNVIEQAISGGVNVVQLRDKLASDQDLIAAGKHLKQQLSPYNIPLLVNDRLDVAIAIDADGVHIGQRDISYATARSKLGNNKIIGLTINNLQQAKQASHCGADYFGVGPIYPTSTKPDATEALGTKALAEICENLPQQEIIAIGGIQIQHVNELCTTGITGIAVVSAILAAPDLKLTAQQFKEELLCRKNITVY